MSAARSVVATTRAVPLEVCHIVPSTVCKKTTKLVPHLSEKVTSDYRVW